MDQFLAGDYYRFTFQRDTKGRIAGLKVSASVVKDVGFEKIN